MLMGTIQTAIAAMASLWLFNVSNIPELSGPVPSEFGGLTDLSYLGVSNTGVSGSIPSELGLLTYLRILEASNTSLVGRIPTELGLMSLLLSIDLSFNTAITGILPSELGSSTQLERIDVSYTSLSGPFPADISLHLLPCLHEIYLQGTSLDGNLATSLCFDFSSAIENQLQLFSEARCSLPYLDVSLRESRLGLSTTTSLPFDHGFYAEANCLQAGADGGGGGMIIECPCCTRCCDLAGNNCIQT